MTNPNDDNDDEEAKEGSMRIDYDDQLNDVVDKVNEVLATHGLEFVDDGQVHDGFCIYTLVKIHPS